MRLHPDKKPFRVLRKWKDGRVTFVEYEADFWHGPTGEPNEQVGYETVRGTVNSQFWRNSISRSVSFWPKLAKELGVAA